MDLVSQCTLRVAKVVWRPGHGGFAFTVVCKATFELRPDVSPLAAEQDVVALADGYADTGALAVASELVPAKKRPEVLLTGHAYAPEGRPVPSLLARLVVGEIDKTIHVVGDSYFGRNGRLSDPEVFTRMPLGWERADGGLGTFNPAGRSLGSAARPDALGRIPAPNLLPAGLRLKSRSDTVSPVGFGPIAPQWPSRTACLHQHAAGWDPGRWNERPLPADIDLGYFNAAPSDQQRALPFGEEAIYLENLHPRIAQLSTRLAPVAPAATVDHGAGPQALQLRCDTLIIDTDRGLAMLVWRAHVLLDHPDRPGRVVVTGPGTPQVTMPAWAANATANEVDLESTIVPRASARRAAALPFSQTAVGAPKNAAPEPMAPGRVERPSRSLDDEDGGTMAAVVGFKSSSVLPFAFPKQAAVGAPDSAAPEPTPPGHVEMRSPSLDGEDGGTMAVVAGFKASAAALPFVIPKSESLPRHEMPPVASAPALPFMRAPPNEEGEGDGPATSRPPEAPEMMPQQVASAPLAASWGPLVPQMEMNVETPSPYAAVSSWAMPPIAVDAWRAPELRAAPLAESETPAPPPMIGPIAVVAAEGARAEVPASEAATVVEAAEPEVPIDVEVYPPVRCGGIAARLACAGVDEGKFDEILRGEDLDARRWQRVHAHWLVRIHEEAARSRKTLLAEYDGGYVGALEGARGTIGLSEYAQLAEAAERGEVVGALAELGLPAGGWAHVHRVWIGRMVVDVRVGKQVKGAIEARRAAG
jgi:hypothetical protein